MKIAAIVAAYERDCYDEFLQFMAAQRPKADTLNTTFAETKGTDYINRLLYEIPETLSNLFTMKLDDAEAEFLRSKEGGRWFAKTFMQYNVSKHT